MQRFAPVVLSALLLLASSAAVAHEGHDHGKVFGTIQEIEKDHIVVKDRVGKSVTIRTTGETEFKDKNGDTTRAKLAVGDRVVVTTAGKGESLTADEVRFSHPGAPRAQEPPAARP